MQHDIGKKIRNNIIFGALILTPLIATFIVMKWVFLWITDLILIFVPKSEWMGHPFIFRPGALIVEIALLFFIGLMVRNIIGARLYHWAETLFVRIPLISKIYMSVRQILEAFVSDRKSQFQEVVAVEYPSPGIYSVGFVTAVVPPDMCSHLHPLKDGDEYLSVLLPHTPNPMSGWLCIIERSKVIPLPLNVGDAMKLIVSCGAVYPGYEKPEDKRPSFLDKLDSWMARKESRPDAEAVK